MFQIIKTTLAGLFALTVSTHAHAFVHSAGLSPQNVCYYGASSNGAPRYPFVMINDASGNLSRYESRITSDLVATVTVTRGHSTAYHLRLDYKNSAFEMSDSYVDFAPMRPLSVTGKIQGQSVSCSFDLED